MLAVIFLVVSCMQGEGALGFVNRGSFDFSGIM
jgi:hypothetical protein